MNRNGPEKDSLILINEDGTLFDMKEYYRKTKEKIMSLHDYAQKIDLVLNSYPCCREWQKADRKDIQNLEAVRERKIPLKKAEKMYYREKKSQCESPGEIHHESYICAVVYIGKKHATMYEYSESILEEEGKMPFKSKIREKLKDKDVFRRIGRKYE